MKRIAALAFFVLTNCGQPSTEKKVPKVIVIDPGADVPMTPDQYPQTFLALGAAEFERANALIASDARQAAADERCDRVSTSMVSDRSMRGDIQTFVDCANNTRFRYEEGRLSEVKTY